MKRWFVRAAAVAVLIVAAGCAGTTETRATTALATACGTFTELVEEAARRNAAGELSAAQVARVDGAVAAGDPFCLPGAEVDPNTVEGVLRGAIDDLGRVLRS